MIRNQKRQFARNQKNIKRKNIFSKILFYLILLSFLGTIIYTFFFSGLLKIISINISGNENVETELILNEINSKIEGKYLNFLEKNNLFLIKTSSVREDIKEKFKGIEEIEITRKFPDGLEVVVKERNPSVIFCNLDKCLVLDEFGKAYDDGNSFLSSRDKGGFLKIIDESNRDFDLDDFVLTTDYINYIQSIKKEIEFNFEFKLKNEFRTPNLISDDIRVRTEDDWEIYFNSKIELTREIEMLRAVLKNNLASQEKRNNLDYIDLRVDSKIFYNFREGTPERIAKEAQIKAEKEAEEKAQREEEKQKENDDKDED